MEKAPAFGRARPASRAGSPPVPPKRHISSAPPALDETPVEAELQAWNSQRARPAFPWRPFLLMAGLCFGAGSLILPDSVNDAASWALYALTAISFFLGLRRRRAKL
jgi:hypothetical protein